VIRRRDDDQIAAARRAGAADRNERVYAQRRARRTRERAASERRSFDPRPPTDDDWTVAEEDTDGLRRLRPPEPVGDMLGAFVARRGWGERLGGATLASHWLEVVGPDMASRSEPVRLAGGVLVVRASTAVWATQLRYLIPQLQSNAAEVLGPGRPIREVRIVVGPLEGVPTDET
jgi:predicted nucleic acid-binding Zn ribbon protein